MECDLEKTRLREMFSHERKLWAQGIHRIAGVDEAGRGPLAGPVVAAVCILPGEVSLPGLNDSKQVGVVDRAILYDQITTLSGCEWAIGVATVAEIDQLNILRATFLAMYRAVEGLQAHKKPDLILVDGHLAPSFGIPTIPLVGGDAASASIAAASILAKVTRDRMMSELHELFPQYGFLFHKGYATPEHLKAIHEFGPASCHRASFEPIKSMCVKELQGELF